jgi:nitrite reductase/ring-hydroxylating ferredoxin subunit
MAPSGHGGYQRGLVDMSTGQVSREIFVSEDIYQEELERVFTRAWLFVGHESQIPKPGDYFVSSMGEESVLLCRDREEKVHVFLNSCRHRGMKVCRYDEGNTPVFTCPYHGWSYAADGRLVGVPYFKEAYHGKLDKLRWGLIEVAQLCTYKGIIWATWDSSAPPFLEYLGDFKLYLDLSLDAWDGGEGGTEVLGGIQKWLIPSNWKYQPPLGGPGGHRPQRHWAPGYPGTTDGAPAADLFPRTRPPDRRLPLAEGPADACGVPGLARGVGVFQALRSRTATAARGMGTVDGQPRGDFPEYGSAPTSAAHHRRLASPWRASD